MLCEGDVIAPEELGLGDSGLGLHEEHIIDRPVTPVPTGQNGHTGPNGLAQHPPPAPVPGHLVFDFVNGPHLAEEVERELVMQALRHTQGNVSRAAKLIGMQRSSLRYRIERYQLDSFVAEMSNRC
jgi:DNA-binding NtrC family response regulator